MSEPKSAAFHRQYVRIFNSGDEVNRFVERHADNPWFEVNSAQVRLIPLGQAFSYSAERYVVLYTASEPLA